MPSAKCPQSKQLQHNEGSDLENISQAILEKNVTYEITV
jgi:hypothetical protein